jgi:hypothetical protein
MSKLLSVAVLMTLVASPAWSQVPNPCPPTAAAPSSSTTGSSSEPPEKQPVERSAILPDAGGEGQSAAPTVQQNGRSVEAQTECPKPPNRMDAPKQRP